MLIIKRGYQRKYQVCGSGIFSKLKDFLSGFISKKQVVDTALNIARSAWQKAGQKAIDFPSSKLTPKSQQILLKLVSPEPSLAPQGSTPQKAQQVTSNLNNLIAGSGSARSRFKTLSDGWIKKNEQFWTNQGCFWKAWSPLKQYRWTQIFQLGIEL